MILYHDTEKYREVSNPPFRRNMKALKKLWNIVTGKDKNWDGSVDIKDKMISAKQKTLKETDMFKPKK